MKDSLLELIVPLQNFLRKVHSVSSPWKNRYWKMGQMVFRTIPYLGHYSIRVRLSVEIDHNIEEKARTNKIAPWVIVESERLSLAIKNSQSWSGKSLLCCSFTIWIPQYIQMRLSGFCHFFIVFSFYFPQWWVLMVFPFLWPGVFACQLNFLSIFFSSAWSCWKISLCPKHNMYFLALDLSSCDSAPSIDTRGMCCSWMLMNSSMQISLKQSSAAAIKTPWFWESAGWTSRTAFSKLTLTNCSGANLS